MANKKLSNLIYKIEKTENTFKTLKEVMPEEFITEKYINTKAYKFKDINILTIFSILDENYLPWPGKNKNIHKWIILENGYAVGIYAQLNKKYSFPIKKCAIYEISSSLN